MPSSTALPERTLLALEDYDMSAARGHVTSDTDVLDIAARWTVTCFDAPVDDADAWADFDALAAAVFERHEQRQEAGQ